MRDGRSPIIVLCLLMLFAVVPSARAADRPPNIVIIFADDLGYGDLGVYGAKGYETPHLDRMAAEGVRFTNFYAAQAVCSASRAALLTGCYPNRIGILGALGPNATHGIHDNELTLAELCKQKGYATAIYGKWHLGHHRKFLPMQHGFDDYYGLPYSNDMWPHHPTAKFPDLPMIEGNDIVNAKVSPDDQTRLTTDYTTRAVRFIERNKDRPFFLYVPHSMPHVPLYASEKFRGKTRRGVFGDVIAEIDWSAGQILEAIRTQGLDRQTLVIFTSDNGPWLSYGDHAGSAGPLREGKGTSWDGGQRVPCIMRYPGVIPGGAVQHEPAMTIDILPTIAHLIGGKLPDHPIDGKNIWPLITAQPDAKCPHEALYFYWGGHLQGMRSGTWSMHFPHAYPSLNGREGGKGGQPVAYQQLNTDLALFNLEADIAQSVNVADKHPDVVERLKALADKARAELGDTATNTQGAGARPPGRL